MAGKKKKGKAPFVKENCRTCKFECPYVKPNENGSLNFFCEVAVKGHKETIDWIRGPHTQFNIFGQIVGKIGAPCPGYQLRE